MSAAISSFGSFLMRSASSFSLLRKGLFILIKSPDEWATTKQACRDELVVYLFFSPIYSSLYFHVLSTVLRISSFTLYIYIYVYVNNCRQYCFGLLGLISAVLIARMKVSL